VTDDEGTAWKWDRVENDTAGWIELDLSGLQSDDGSPIPYRLVVNRFKSSSPDSEAFINDPIAAFKLASETVDAFRDIDESWRVTTLVVNHNDTLSVSHVYSNVTVNASNQTVGVTIVKKP